MFEKCIVCERIKRHIKEDSIEYQKDLKRDPGNIVAAVALDVYQDLLKVIAKEEKFEMDMMRAMVTLQKAFKENSEYALTWYTNISTLVSDEGITKQKSNRIAGRFMKTVFGIDL